jgi:hypothetical protein
MARRDKGKRNFDPISLSFLDVISCGFGAVVLIFLILDHSLSTQKPPNDPEIAAEIDLLHEEIQTGELGLVRVRNTVSDVDLQMVQAQGRARSIQQEIDTFLEELAQMENSTLAEQESVEKLKADIQSLEEELERLKAAQDAETGDNIREFIGDGSRQYLTGLILGGNRILVLVDISGSMLDNTIVNIIRRRNMSIDARLASPKWTQVRKTVDWLTAQLPPPSQYQIYVFNNQARALLPGTEGTWLEVADEQQLTSAVNLLNQTVPTEGTNLENLFTTIKQLSPAPDNIFLITDGLPTLGSRGRDTGTISGRDREQLFERAVRELPTGIPVNVIMAPLEGDPMAASLYWQLAVSTGGSFLSPSEDWP